MAYSVLSNNSPGGKPVYVADSIADLTALKETNPSMGVSCAVLSDGKVYIFNSAKKWVPILNTSGSSGEGDNSYYNAVLKMTDTGSTIHTADAYIGAPLIEAIIYGYSAQNGVPTTENPVGIKSITDAKIITAEDTTVFDSTQLIFTDVNDIKHKLQSVPNGKRDELIVYHEDFGILRARTAERTITEVGNLEIGSNNLKYATLTFDRPILAWESAEAMLAETGTTELIPGYCTKCGYDKEGMYIGVTWNGAYAYITSATATQIDFNALIGATVILRQPVTEYEIPAISLPSLPAHASNIWVDATNEDNESVNTNITVTYRRDVNMVINNLEEAVADIVIKS